MLADGSQIAIKDVRPGDSLWNPITEQVVVVAVKTENPPSAGMMEIGYGDHTVLLTSNHPVFTQNGLKTAKELTFDDYLLGDDGKFHQVTVLRDLPIDPLSKVMNLLFVGTDQKVNDNYLVSNGIVTGNLLLQLMLAGKVQLPG